MTFYTIESNLSSNTYNLLLDWALKEAFSFSLVWRQGLSLQKTAVEFEQKLRPHLIKEELTNEWPGTKVCAPPEETIRFYRISKQTIELLRSATSAFEWLAPALPEDLAFYDRDNNPWFGSVAHEHLAFLFGDDSIVVTAKKWMPELIVLPGREWKSDT